MPAKDYKLAVSGLGGKAYITKVSKVNPHLMLSDRVALDDGVALQFIEEFAKHRVTKTESIMQCKDIDGKLIYEVHFPDAASEERKSAMRQRANEIVVIVTENPPTTVMLIEYINELVEYVQRLTPHP